MSKHLQLSSPAKINLRLEVGPKDTANQKHFVQTVLHRISLADKIKLTFRGDNFWLISGNNKVPREQDLMYQACEFVAKYYGVSVPGINIIIQKNIPIGGGLGGGSSNFATIVRGLQKMLDLPDFRNDSKNFAQFLSAAAQYGVDIPFFFLDTSMAFGKGFGDKMQTVRNKFIGQKIFLYIPPFSHLSSMYFSYLAPRKKFDSKNFHEDFSLNEAQNDFDVLFDLKEYRFLRSDFSGFHITGSGSCFWSLESHDIEGVRRMPVELI